MMLLLFQILIWLFLLLAIFMYLLCHLYNRNFICTRYGPKTNKRIIISISRIK